MYELFLALPAQLNEGQLKAKTEQIEEKIKAIGGKLKETFEIGRRPFAYPIITGGKRYNDGYFADFYFESSKPQALKTLEEQLRLEPTILKFLIVKQEKIPEAHPLIKQPQPAASEKPPKTAPKKPVKTKPKAKAAAQPAKPRPSEKQKVKLEKFDEKLDEILKT